MWIVLNILLALSLVAIVRTERELSHLEYSLEAPLSLPGDPILLRNNFPVRLDKALQGRHISFIGDSTTYSLATELARYAFAIREKEQHVGKMPADCADADGDDEHAGGQQARGGRRGGRGRRGHGGGRAGRRGGGEAVESRDGQQERRLLLQQRQNHIKPSLVGIAKRKQAQEAAEEAKKRKKKQQQRDRQRER